MEPTTKSLIDSFDFKLFGSGTDFPFKGYISSIDPTTAAPAILIGGSQNVFKTLSGSIANRDGLKRLGPANATLDGVASSYEWYTSLGNVDPIRVLQGGDMEVMFGASNIWYPLFDVGTNTRVVFDTWWDDNAKKDRLIFVNGTPNLYSWSGGIGTVASVTTSTVVLSGTQTALQQGFDDSGSFIANGVEYAYTAAGVSEGNAISHTDTTVDANISTTAWHAQKFATSATSTQIIRATARIKIAGSSTPDAVFGGAIYTDNAGVPGTLLSSAEDTIEGAFSPGDFTLSFNFNLASTPLTNYHLVLYCIDPGGTTYTLYRGNTGSTGTSVSANAGASWSAENGYLYATVIENNANLNTLIGVTPDPSALVAGDVIVQKVTSSLNVPDNDFNCDFIKTIGNQLHVGSYNSRLVYISSDSDYLDYVVPVPRAPGDPDLLTLDSSARGITVQKGATDQSGNAVISGGLGDWYTVVRSNVTVGTTLTEQVNVIRSASADLATALAHEFIELVGDSILFLDQNNQLRQFGTIRNIVTPVYPLLSLDVYTEFKGRDFTGGHMRAVADEGDISVYITCPVQGIDYFYQIRQQLDTLGNLTAERLWQPPQVRNISRIAVINGITYGHSNSNPQIYQLWGTQQYYDDSPSDEEIPYTSSAIFSYLHSARTRQTQFDRLYFDGYMTPGSEVYCKIYWEYQGANGITSVTINKPDIPGRKLATFYTGTTSPSIGDSSLGTIPVGDGILPTDSDNPPKFRAMRRTEPGNVFDYALEVRSDAVDSQWSLLGIGTNQQQVDTEPTGIMGLRN